MDKVKQHMFGGQPPLSLGQSSLTCQSVDDFVPAQPLNKPMPALATQLANLVSLDDLPSTTSIIM
jgi:hypothetical protein